MTHLRWLTLREGQMWKGIFLCMMTCKKLPLHWILLHEASISSCNWQLHCRPSVELKHAFKHCLSRTWIHALNVNVNTEVKTRYEVTLRFHFNILTTFNPSTFLLFIQHVPLYMTYLGSTHGSVYQWRLCWCPLSSAPPPHSAVWQSLHWHFASSPQTHL